MLGEPFGSVPNFRRAWDPVRIRTVKNEEASRAFGRLIGRYLNCRRSSS